MEERPLTGSRVSHHDHLITLPGDSDFSWRRWVKVFLLGLALLCLAIALLNFVTNPLALYPVHLVRSPIWQVSHEKVLLMAETRAQALILGSSHAMKISPTLVRQLSGLTAFNAAVDMATLEDEFALLKLAVEGHGWPLKLALIAVDPETFGPSVQNNTFVERDRELARYVTHSHRPAPLWEEAPTLLSGEQARTSLKTLNWLRLGAPRDRYFDADGYLHWQSLEKQRSRGTFNLARGVDSSVELLGIRYRAFTGLSVQSENLLGEMLHYCRDHKIQVKLFIAPLHPAARRAVAEPFYDRLLSQTADFTRTSATAHDAEFYDLSDLSAFQGRPEAFYDGEHVDSVNADLMTVRMLRAQAGHAVQ